MRNRIIALTLGVISPVPVGLAIMAGYQSPTFWSGGFVGTMLLAVSFLAFSLLIACLLWADTR